ncbi:MAG: hypothetical protein EXS03_06510 [Phycisphaerales bacterium]|nr:hypothetical protein [Phycisphaerales bacterium]
MLIKRGSRVAAIGVGVIIAAFASQPVLADFTNPSIPAWRGGPAAAFFAWESFTSPFGGANDPNYAGTDTGAALFNFTMGASITGAGNLFGAQSPLSVMVIGGLTNRVNEVVLNLSTLGTVINLDSVRLTLADNAGHNYTSIFHYTQLRSDVAAPSGQGQIQTRAFKWQLPAGGTEFNPTRFTVDFSSQTINMALDAVSLDFHYVPAPTAVALASLAGLVGTRRRRRA